MKKEEMDLWLKKSLEGHGSPVPIGGWKGLHQSKKKKKRKSLIWFVAAGLSLFAGMALWTVEIPGDFISEPLPIKEIPVTSLPEREENTGVPLPPPHKAKRDLSVGTLLNDPQAERTRTPRNTEKPEENEMPEPDDTRLKPFQAQSIANMRVGQFSLSTGNEAGIQKLVEKFSPRFPKPWSVVFEAGINYGNLNFSRDASLAQYRSSYSSFIKSQNLHSREYRAGFLAYYQAMRRWSVGSGLFVSYTKASGNLHYAYYESGLNLVSFGAQNWPDNTLDIAEKLDHTTSITSWSIGVPLRFRYQPFARVGPLVEFGATYSYNLKNEGNWIDPETLTIGKRNDLVSKHHISADFALGYQWRGLTVFYRYSPQNTLFMPVQGSLSADLHGISIQLQMPQSSIYKK